MKTRIRLARGTDSKFRSATSTSVDGNPIYNKDKKYLYIGDDNNKINALEPITSNRIIGWAQDQSNPNNDNCDYKITYNGAYLYTASNKPLIWYADSKIRNGSQILSLQHDWSSYTFNNNEYSDGAHYMHSYVKIEAPSIEVPTYKSPSKDANNNIINYGSVDSEKPKTIIKPGSIECNSFKGTADDATNVTTSIKGIAIGSIFETNGTTVKNATYASKVGTSSSHPPIGDKDRIIRVDSNGAIVGDGYYVPKLNGSNQTSAASFYAPTGAGTNGQVLKSSGSGAPTWADQSSLSVGSAVNATTASSCTGNSATVTNGVYTTNFNTSSQTSFGNYIIRKEKLLSNATKNVTGSGRVTISYTGIGNPRGRKFRIEYALGINGYNPSDRFTGRKSMEFTVTSSDSVSNETILDQSLIPVTASSGPGLYLTTMRFEGSTSQLDIIFECLKITSFSANTNFTNDSKIYALYEII